jgi:hypothetical protein
LEDFPAVEVVPVVVLVLLLPLELVVDGGDAEDVCEFCFDAMLSFVDTLLLLPPPCVQVVVVLLFLLTSDGVAVIVVLLSFNMNIIQQEKNIFMTFYQNGYMTFD